MIGTPAWGSEALRGSILGGFKILSCLKLLVKSEALKEGPNFIKKVLRGVYNNKGGGGALDQSIKAPIRSIKATRGFRPGGLEALSSSNIP